MRIFPLTFFGTLFIVFLVIILLIVIGVCFL